MVAFLIAGDVRFPDIHLTPLGGIALVLLSFAVDGLWIVLPAACLIAVVFGYVDFSPWLGSRITVRSFPVDTLVIALQFGALVIIMHYFKARIAENSSLGTALEQSVGLVDYHRSRADRDDLTGLYNRAYFQARLPAAVERAKISGQSVAIVFGDLNRFKAINDTFGHAAGDEVLKHSAERVRSAIRGNDIAARWGGDEFAVLIEGLHSRTQAAKIVAKLNAAFEGATLTFDERQVSFSLSLGVALFPDDAADAKGLFAYADAAMYRQKGQADRAL